MHDLSKLTPDDMPGARAACETLISFREALDPRFYDKVCALHAGIDAREQRYELEDTAKVTRMRKHLDAQIAAFNADGATMRVLPECWIVLGRCAEMFGQIKDRIHTMEIAMNEAGRRAEERLDDLIRRIDDLAELNGA